MLGLLFKPKVVSAQVGAEQLREALDVLAKAEGLEVNQNYLLEQTRWDVLELEGLGKYAIVNSASRYITTLVQQSAPKDSILNVLNWFLAVQIGPKTNSGLYLDNPVLMQQSLYRQQLFDDWLKIHLSAKA